MNTPLSELNEKSSRLESVAFYIIAWTTLLLPVFFIPSPSLPFQMTKTALVLFAVLIAFFLYIIARLREGKVMLPRLPALIAIWALPLAYLISSFFSGNINSSLIGAGFELDTFSFIAVMGLMVFLLPALATTKKQISSVFLALFVSFAVLTIFLALRLFLGPSFLSFGIFTAETSNLLGKWNDLGIFFGLIAILSLVTLERPNFSKFMRLLAYVILIISLVFLAIINFFLVWVVVGIFALGFFVYNLSRDKLNWRQGVLAGAGINEESESVSKKKILYTTLGVVILSLIFIISGGKIGNAISDALSISQIEARPAWQSTIGITKETYKENLLFGSGPNTFQKQWSLFKPRAINDTLFWNVNFASGVGFVPTSFATVGIAGGLSWLALIVLLLYTGFKALVAGAAEDRFSYFLSLSLFLGSLFLWIMMIIYVPNVSLIAISFFFTGMFFASLRFGTRGFLAKEIVFSENPRLGFISVLILTVFLIIGSVSLYALGRQYISAVKFQNAFIAVNSSGDLDEGRDKIESAIRYGQEDIYYRFATDLNMTRLNAITADTSSPLEERRVMFQQALAQAVSTAQRASEIDEKNFQNWTSLGRVYGSVVPLGIEGAYESARRSYERALELNPQNPSIYLNLARLDVSRGDFGKARENIQRALERKGDYTEAIFLLSQIEIQTGNIPEAIRSVEAATVINPNNPAYLFQLGLLQYSAGNNGKAIEAFERAIALNADYANALYFLGLSYHRIGETGLAINHFTRVLELNPDNADIARALENLRAGRDPFTDTSSENNVINLESLPVEEVPVGEGN
jgi:tetratricopeptide (TPR) repeat protein